MQKCSPGTVGLNDRNHTVNGHTNFRLTLIWLAIYERKKKFKWNIYSNELAINEFLCCKFGVLNENKVRKRRARNVLAQNENEIKWDFNTKQWTVYDGLWHFANDDDSDDVDPSLTAHQTIRSKHTQKHINTDSCENRSKSLAIGVFCKCVE